MPKWTPPTAGHRAEYTARVNRVVDHIERNLHEPLSLAALADIANLSRFHFHRVFGAMVGETLNQFIQRLRLEKAARMLLGRPDLSITAVAIDCGFSSPATFARAFKAGFGTNATQWRSDALSSACKDDRKIGKQVGKLSNAAPAVSCYIDSQTAQLSWRLEMQTTPEPLTATVDVQELPERNVAYLRHVGPYGQTAVIPRLFAELRTWVAARGLIDQDTVSLVVAHDNPNVTADDKLRLSVCMTVPEATPCAGEVGMMSVPGGRFGVARFEIPPARIAEAWGAVMGGWLPDSGYQPDDRFCYEVALNNPADHPEGKILLDICVPVRPL